MNSLAIDHWQRPVHSDLDVHPNHFAGTDECHKLITLCNKIWPDEEDNRIVLFVKLWNSYVSENQSSAELMELTRGLLRTVKTYSRHRHQQEAMLAELHKLSTFLFPRLFLLPEQVAGVAEFPTRPKEEITPHIGKKLGSGAFGNVWELNFPPTVAKARNEPREQALKTFRKKEAEVGMVPACTDREHDAISVEARALSLLASPYVVQLYGVMTYIDSQSKVQVCGLLLELCIGSLEDAIVNRDSQARCCLEPWDNFNKRVGIVQSCAQAVQHMHEKGFLHRDIKSPNFLIRANGNIVISDVAAAKVAPNSVPTVGALSGLQSLHEQRGSLTHMPRHLHFSNDPQYSEATDNFGLGVMINEVMSGELYASHISMRPDEVIKAIICTPWHLISTMFQNKSFPAEKSNAIRDLLRSIWLAGGVNVPSAQKIVNTMSALLVDQTKGSCTPCEDDSPDQSRPLLTPATTQILDSYDTDSQAFSSEPSVAETTTVIMYNPQSLSGLLDCASDR